MKLLRKIKQKSVDKMFKGIAKKAAEQGLKGAALQTQVESYIYNSIYTAFQKSIETKRLTHTCRGLIKIFVEPSFVKVQKPNKSTIRFKSALDEVLANKKKLELHEEQLINKIIIPYLKACEEKFKGELMDDVMPLLTPYLNDAGVVTK